jgi:hypothetical protein
MVRVDREVLIVDQHLAGFRFIASTSKGVCTTVKVPAGSGSAPSAGGFTHTIWVLAVMVGRSLA